MTVGQIVVVSDDPRTANALAEHHDVEVVAPGDLAGWVAATTKEPADVVVLELGTPESSRAAVTELRAKARMCPVLVIANGDSGWGRAENRELPGALVLPFPLQPGALLDAVSRVVDHGLGHLLTPQDGPGGTGADGPRGADELGAGGPR